MRMGVFFDNFIANMYGPHFLVFYLFWIIAISVLTWFAIKKLSQVYFQPVLLSGNVNPYEVATLRGIDSLLSVIVFRLLHLGFLMPVSDRPQELVKNFNKSEQHKQALSELERKLLKHFRTPAAMTTAREHVQPAFFHNLRLLQNDSLIVSGSNIYLIHFFAWFGFVAIVGMGFYKLIVALTTGHNNVVFLCIMLLLSGVIYYNIVLNRKDGLLSRQRALLTNKGVSLINHLMRTLGVLRKDQQALEKVVQQKDENTLLLMFALFGLSSINIAQVRDYSPLFPTEMLFSFAIGSLPAAKSVHASSTGGGVGSGGCSSIGCGSGCGGGCGGCG